MADFPRVKYKVIDGRSVPFTEPQHFVGSGDETVRTGESNPLPTKDGAVEARLQSIEQTQTHILAKLNDTIDTRLTGSIVEDYVKDEESIPPANSVPLGAFCMVVDTGNIWQSNGVEWKVFA